MTLPFDWESSTDSWILCDRELDSEYFACAVMYVGSGKPEHNLEHGDCFGLIGRFLPHYEQKVICFYSCDGSADAIDFVDEAADNFAAYGRELFLKEYNVKED